MRLKKLSALLKAHSDQLHNDYGIKALYVFGSISQNTATKRSDIDLIVEFKEGTQIGLFEFVQLQEYLQKILKRHVDLVTRDSLKQWMTDTIESESIRVA